jgi:hypothetical protein
MGKGSWRRPGDDRAFQENYDRAFGRKPSEGEKVTKDDIAEIRERAIALTLDELRSLVFKTSVAYARPGRSIQEAEWARAAALRDALQDLGFDREAEMIGGAG